MRIAFAVFLLLVTYTAGYPSLREASDSDDENDLELKLRSILNQLSSEEEDEQPMTRSLDDAEEDEDSYSFSKRQGGHNIVDKQSKCEIECIHTLRHPQSGKGKTVKEAAKACKKMCPNPNKTRGNGKKPGKQPKDKKMTLRELEDDDSNSSENQRSRRRELYEYLMEQLQQDNDS